MLANVNQHAVAAKVILAPLGVGALLYWTLQEQSLSLSTNPSLLLGGGILALLSILPFALRLRAVLKLINFDVSTLNASRILTQSMFYYFFVPLSVGTEVSKFAKLGNLNPTYPKTKLASAIALDHLVGLFVLLLISAGLYIAIEPVVIRINHITVISIAVAAVLIAAGTGFYLTHNRRLGWRQVAAMIFIHKKHLCVASFYSLLMHLTIAAAVYAGALHWQITISYWQILFVLTGAFLFQMVPVNVVGVSAIEIAGAGLYLSIGLPVAEALSLVSLLYCYRVLIALCGGLWEFLNGWRAQQTKPRAS